MPIPRVSVLMPVYNAERYLSAALKSIQDQTFPNFECVVVDDGSSDKSAKIAESFAQRDPRFRVLTQANAGIVKALNAGLESCRGHYIARMDADDVALPERLSKQVEYLDNHPDVVGLGTWVLFTDPGNNPLLRFQPKTSHEAITASLRSGDIGGLIHPAMMMRTDVVKMAGAYREESLWVEDYDLFLRLSEIGKLEILPEILLRYRQHPKSVNRTKNEQERHQRKQEALNAYCARQSCNGVAIPKLLYNTDTDKQWAYWAAQDGYYRSAFRWGWHRLLRRPVDKESWRCLNYALKRAWGIIPGPTHQK